MKRLLRRIFRVADASTFSSPLLPRPKSSSHSRLCRSCRSIRQPDSAPVPAGHLPLRVEDPSGGGASCRFVVPAELLSAPALSALLRRSAQEYGYDQSGVLRIPCSVVVFQRVLDSLLAGGQKQQRLDARDVPRGEEDDVEGWLWDGEEEWNDPEWSPPALQRGGAAQCCWCC